jgi:Cd2+/Zn2+-exporting ATPase
MDQRKQIIIICIAVLLFAAAVAWDFGNPHIRLAVYLAAFFAAGSKVLVKAGKSMNGGRVFNENFLMSIAAIGAFLIGEYPEGVAVMVLYRIGELFESYAVGKSRKSIAGLMDIRPEYANLKSGDDLYAVSPEEVVAGDHIVIKPGERIPLDGRIVDGHSMIDVSALTGESVPREVVAGDEILSGAINMSGVLTVEVTKGFADSTVSRILDLIENSLAKKSKSESFITKFAGYYTPAVVAAAVLLALIPPLVMGGRDFGGWLYRALVFLVISCPCALVISVPLGFFGGIGGASKQGILVKGGNYLEALCDTEIVVFDKTGTLTKGVFEVREIAPRDVPQAELLRLAAHAESFSNHPISHSLRRAHGREIDVNGIENIEEIPGHGVRALVEGRTVLAGNAKLMKKYGVSSFDAETDIDIVGTAVHVALDGEYAGYIRIADEPREDAKRAIDDLKKAGIKKTVMLTGDVSAAGKAVAGVLSIDMVYSELLPADKVGKVEELYREKSARGKLVYAGDGLNDAPVLARADIGIAMGGLGSDAAIEAADIVIMTDEPSKIADAIKISKRTLGIVKQNIVLSLAIKGLILIFAAFGRASMWAGVFADVGVSMIAIMNSMRALRSPGGTRSDGTRGQAPRPD